MKTDNSPRSISTIASRTTNQKVRNTMAKKQQTPETSASTAFFAPLLAEKASLRFLPVAPVSIVVKGIESTKRTFTMGTLHPTPFDTYGLTQIIPSTCPEDKGFTLANHDPKSPKKSWWTDTEILALHSAAEGLAFNWEPIAMPDGRPYGRFFVNKHLPKNGKGAIAVFHILCAPKDAKNIHHLPPFALPANGLDHYDFSKEIEVPEPKAVSLTVHGEKVELMEEWFKVEALNFSTAHIVRIEDDIETFGMDWDDHQQKVLHAYKTYEMMNRLVNGEKFHATIYTPERKGTNDKGAYCFVDYKMALKAGATVRRINEMTIEEARKDRNGVVEAQRQYLSDRVREDAMVATGKIERTYVPLTNAEGEQIGVQKVFSTPGQDASTMPATVEAKDFTHIYVKFIGSNDFEVCSVNDTRIYGRFQGYTMAETRKTGREEVVRNSNRVLSLRKSGLKLEQISK